MGSFNTDKRSCFSCLRLSINSVERQERKVKCFTSVSAVWDAGAPDAEGRPQKERDRRNLQTDGVRDEPEVRR